MVVEEAEADTQLEEEGDIKVVDVEVQALTKNMWSVTSATRRDTTSQNVQNGKRR